MSTARRFVFAERTKSGADRLMLANLDARAPFGQRTARIIAQLGIVPGPYPSAGAGPPEVYAGLCVRPDNAFAAAYTAQTGIDFVDWNIAVYDMETGAGAIHFNEHSVANVNRANCPCAVFDALLASEAAAGVPQSFLDSLDYSVVAEGTGVGEPDLAWSEAGTLLVTFAFDVMAGAGYGVIGRADFTFEVALIPPPGGTVTILSRNAGIAPAPVPHNPFAIRPLASRLLPTGPAVIHYGNAPVAFWPWPWKWLPGWFGGLASAAAYRPAERVQGFV